MIGQTIAHYQITAKLGEGGIGDAIEASHRQGDRLQPMPLSFAILL
jgi:hypothetical protein